MTISLEEAVARGMTIAYHAANQPDVPAVVSDYGDRSFEELNHNANRLARALRDAGLGNGDSVAVVARNRPEFVEALAAAERIGVRFTPINFHLKGEEIGYIVDNCDAKAFIADAGIGAPAVDALAHAQDLNLKLAVGGALEGFQSYNAVIDQYGPADIADPSLGGRTRAAPMGRHPLRLPTRQRRGIVHGTGLSRRPVAHQRHPVSGLRRDPGHDGQMGAGRYPASDRRAQDHSHPHGRHHVPPAAAAAG
jgi:hypothetical protein